jgi:hypothetical protein
MSNFSKEDIQSAFLKEIGIMSILSTIKMLYTKKAGTPKKAAKELKYYNIYPELELFRNEVLDKSNILNSTNNDLLYEDILNCNKNFREEMILVARKIYQSINNDKTSLEIKNLKKPVRWTDVSILYSGESIKIKQSDTIISGELFLDEIGIKKSKKKGAKTSALTFFTSLFISEGSEQLDSTKNINQQNKSSVSRILKDLFGTNEDPIQILNKKYYPKFKATLSGDLAEINIYNYSSGRKFYDNDAYSE